MKRAFTIILALVLILSGITPAARAEDSFGTGIVQDNVYWNETMKIGCQLDESWYFYSEEEILAANGMTADLLEGNIAEIIENGGVITDMFAQSMETGATLNVVFERLSLANSLFYNEKSYIEASISTVEDTFAKMGIENVEIALQQTDFMGEAHESCVITGLYNDVPIYEQVVVAKSGRNVIAVTVFTVTEEEMEEILSSFFNTLD